MRNLQQLIPLTLTLIASAVSLQAQQRPQQYDLVVYGGTAGGVITAVSAARHGLKAVVLEPGTHVGGMVTGGLSRTDVGKREVIGGMSLEFYVRLAVKYDLGRFLHNVAWLHEPKVGEQVFQEMLTEAGVPVLYRHRLREKTGVRKDGTQVTEIVMENGSRFTAKIFADCSYEGDLMAQANVKYTWGRESVAQYGEDLAGVRGKTPFHQFLAEVQGKGADGKLLPEISPEPPGRTGDADKKVQAYNFRLIPTNVAANRIPWPKPAGYDPKRYELLARNLKAETARLGRPLKMNDMFGIGPIPNGKADFNNKGGFSTDYIGKNYGYPEGTYAQRARIWKDHEDYIKGFCYFLAHDPSVPKELQEEANQWGLSRDEFVDTDNWPHQLYVREARRMVGEYVVIQKDVQTDLTKQDVIGMGSYNSDSHNIQRFVNDRGLVENEGDVQVAVKPYQIPFRVMLPKRAEATNLLVPVCFSAAHVAYSSLRMEPQYMIIGHAAGIAAAMAVKAGKPVQDVAVPELQKTLQAEDAVFEFGTTPHQRAMDRIRARLAQPARR